MKLFVEYEGYKVVKNSFSINYVKLIIIL